jgi:hypothetical protein
MCTRPCGRTRADCTRRIWCVLAVHACKHMPEWARAGSGFAFGSAAHAEAARSICDCVGCTRRCRRVQHLRTPAPTRARRTHKSMSTRAPSLHTPRLMRAGGRTRRAKRFLYYFVSSIIFFEVYGSRGKVVQKQWGALVMGRSPYQPCESPRDVHNHIHGFNVVFVEMFLCLGNRASLCPRPSQEFMNKGAMSQAAERTRTRHMNDNEQIKPRYVCFLVRPSEELNICALLALCALVCIA